MFWRIETKALYPSVNQGMGIAARIQAARFLEQGKVAPAEVEAREALRRTPSMPKPITSLA